MATVTYADQTIEIPDAPWTQRERDALRIPVNVRPSVWTTQNCRLSRGQSPRPGPWRHENAPYLRGIMDVAVVPGVAEVYLMKSAQGGGSEATRRLMGYLACRHPDPQGVALPNKEKGESVVNNRIIPMFKETPVLRALMTDRAHDAKKSQIKLRNDVLIHLMWSGSAASMASEPMRFAFPDEVDKFQRWTGREGKPIELIRLRQRTYEDESLLFCTSTPTDVEGEINKLFTSADFKLYYLLACPHCGTRQRLVFPQVKFSRLMKPKAGSADGDEEPAEDKKQWENRVLREPGACWYECRSCNGRIDETQRLQILQTGKWGTCDEKTWLANAAENDLAHGLVADAETVTRWPRKTKLGMHFSALYCTWTKMADVAAEFIAADNKSDKLFTWNTGTLGEPFQQKIEHVEVSVLDDKSKNAALPPGRVPRWAVKLIATVDTQHDHFYLVIRAWGPNMRSQRIHHQRVESPPAPDDFKELDELVFGRLWPYEGDLYPAQRCEIMLIDSGGTKLAGETASRTMAVYRYALSRPALVRAIKGMSDPSERGLFIVPSTGFYDPGDRRSARQKVKIWNLDTHHFQDELAELMRRKEEHLDKKTGELEKIDAWQLNSFNDPEYNGHMQNKQKLSVPEGSQLVERWMAFPAGARVDYRDCEGYQLAGAYMANVHVLPPDDVIEQMRDAAQQEEKRRASNVGGGFTTPDGRPFHVGDRT